MTVYYVYHVKNADPNKNMRVFVHDTAEFALQAFDPATMEFSGVFVEANNPDEAHQIYMNPQAEDVFVSCDEPRPTELKRKAFDARIQLLTNKLKSLKETVGRAENEARRLRTQSLILEISDDFHRIAVRISELARLIRMTTSQENKEKLSDQEVYVKLMERYVEQFVALKYRPGLGGTPER